MQISALSGSLQALCLVSPGDVIHFFMKTDSPILAASVISARKHLFLHFLFAVIHHITINQIKINVFTDRPLEDTLTLKY